MALANAAYTLSKRGKRVLAVDFDLEAPSLHNYGCFEGIEVRQGVVDYIEQYRSSGTAPNVAHFIASCSFKGESLWLMPAGKSGDAAYSEKLASIDWNTLYEKEMGYLFIEDLKQQWAKYDARGFDYVLIDSRTGHTDVGGICTRQLPNLVVAMFVPTRQNIDGLAPIVSEIRKASLKRTKPIDIKFCASNVPDLDDEEDILAELLEASQRAFNYSDQDLSVVHHYSSLDILAHSIFTADRPNSKLSKELVQLTQEIISSNLADGEGAILLVKRICNSIRKAPLKHKEHLADQAISTLNKILQLHPENGEVAIWIATARNLIGDIEGEIEALNLAIRYSDAPIPFLGKRAVALQALNRTSEAKADIKVILSDDRASSAELGPALRILFALGDNANDDIEALLARDDLDLGALRAIAPTVQRTRKFLKPLSLRLKEKLEEALRKGEENSIARSSTVLALIGSGQFRLAIDVLENTRDAEASRSFSVADTFNLSVARWGLEGKADLGLIEKSLPKALQEQASFGDANFVQCMALWLAAVGRKEEAIKSLRDAMARVNDTSNEFSCLSYLHRSADEFRRECEAAIATIEEGSELVPFFFESVDTPQNDEH